MRKIVLAVSLLMCTVCAFATDDYGKAWQALNTNNRKDASAFLEKAAQNPATALDASLTAAFLQAFNGKDGPVNGLVESLEKTGADKNAYLFALWFNDALLGDYGKKSAYQLNLINKIIADNTYNGSLQAAAHYVKSLHYVFANDRSKARQEWAEINALENWQLVGPFENITGTGFNGQFGPLLAPDAGTKFKAINNAEVNWFTPAKMNNEGWIFTHAHIPENTAIIYAQTFVYAPQEMKVLLNAGASGSLKIWVNDALVLSESKERVTELDYYKNHCTLNKGYNRVLVQLGYTDLATPNYIIRFTNENFNALKELKTTAQVQPYTKNTTAGSSASIKHFAEAYFEKKMAAEPDNLINYLLLSQAYMRCSRFVEARQVIDKALKIAPDNSLVRFQL